MLMRLFAATVGTFGIHTARSVSGAGVAPKKYGVTYAVFNSTDMDMVLQCFDDAVKDWRRTFCDVEGCTRK